MKFRFLFSALIISVLISCNDSKKSSLENDESINLEGFWNRIGTIQLVNGLPVDTLLIKNSDNPDFKQIKTYKSNNFVWLNNAKDSLSPWKGGAGGYGKFEINSKDSITESISHGTGGMLGWLNDAKNSKPLVFGLSINFDESNFSQKNNPESEFMEYWERMPVKAPKSKLDGAWKRVYEISYVNGIPVDTLSVSSDVILDVKIIANGRFAYQVDLSNYAEKNTAEYGGFGGFGTYEFDNENSVLTEWNEWGSGTNISSSEPRTNSNVHDITIYNEDLFLQVSRGAAGLTQENPQVNGRGVVYRRLK